MNFTEYLNKSALEIDTEIDAYFANWSKKVVHISPRLKPYVKAFWKSSLGGKRLRGTLVKFGYALTGAGKNTDINKIALAYEIFQTAILAHDDIIDQSQVRRGKQTLHMALGGGHYGISQAISMADAGMFLSYKLIGESKFSEKQKNAALQFFSDTTLFTAFGELLDVDLAKGRETKERETLTVYAYKTAYYTITGPLLLGAVVGGADKKKLDPIKIYGQNMGIAFQIQDDINDIFLDNGQSGKDTGADIKEGKQTLLYTAAKGFANRSQRRILEKYYGNKAISVKDIDKVKKVFLETGALDTVRQTARTYSSIAKDVVSKITQDEDKQNMLMEIAEYCTDKG